jgi:hypothetical protein
MGIPSQKSIGVFIFLELSGTDDAMMMVVCIVRWGYCTERKGLIELRLRHLCVCFFVRENRRGAERAGPSSPY